MYKLVDMNKEKVEKQSKWTTRRIIVVTVIVIFLLFIGASIWHGVDKMLDIKEMNKIEFVHTSKEISEGETDKYNSYHSVPKKYKNNRVIEIDQQDLSGDREANVKVDVGFDTDYATRDYWGYTNKHAQLVYVHADEIILQNDKAEAKWEEGEGRYSPDEAGVQGSTDKDFQKGHAIADSLGGTSTAYNITPQDSYINGGASSIHNGVECHGMEWQLEDDIRENEYNGKEVTNFSVSIYYSEKDTQTPVKYYVSYVVDDSSYEEWTFSNTDSRKYGIY